MSLFRCRVEAEYLHRDEAVASRPVGPKHGTQRADTDLMQHAERAERRRRGEGGRIVSGQLNSSGGIKKM